MAPRCVAGPRGHAPTPHPTGNPYVTRRRIRVMAPQFRAFGWPLPLALLPIGSALPRTASPDPDPPQLLFKDLFVAVQSAQIYSDGKAFPDAVPKSAPGEILKLYHAERPDSPAALKRFVEAHFILPSEIGGTTSPPGRVSILAHIDGLWDTLTRTSATAPPYSSLLTLPEPYVVPGGRFREMYYWDSYFTMQRLAETRRGDLVKDMVGDHAHLIDTYGHVPNGVRTYSLRGWQPPFFHAMVALPTPGDPSAT